MNRYWGTVLTWILAFWCIGMAFVLRLRYPNVATIFTCSALPLLLFGGFLWMTRDS